MVAKFAAEPDSFRWLYRRSSDDVDMEVLECPSELYCARSKSEVMAELRDYLRETENGYLLSEWLAEGARFELADPLRGLQFSRLARSAAPSPLRAKNHRTSMVKRQV